MVKNSFSQQYREVHLSSLSSQETVLMLYDGAIQFLREAIREIGEGNVVAKVRLLEKVAKILEYLQSCLDREKGGEIAENLDSLYEYMLVRLTEANLHNEAPKLEETIRLLGTLREGWSGICAAGKPVEGTTDEPETNKPEKSAKNIRVSI